MFSRLRTAWIEEALDLDAVIETDVVTGLDAAIETDILEMVGPDVIIN